MALGQPHLKVCATTTNQQIVASNQKEWNYNNNHRVAITHKNLDQPRICRHSTNISTPSSICKQLGEDKSLSITIFSDHPSITNSHANAYTQVDYWTWAHPFLPHLFFLLCSKLQLLDEIVEAATLTNQSNTNQNTHHTPRIYWTILIIDEFLFFKNYFTIFLVHWWKKIEL